MRSISKVVRSGLPHVVFVTSHPIQYQVPVFRHLAEHHDIRFTVLFAQIPDPGLQGAGFGIEFEWDIPLLDGYNYRVLRNVAKIPSVTKFSGCDTPEIKRVLSEIHADIVIINGWVVKTCLQTLWACRRMKIPCVVRGESNLLRPRPRWKRLLQRLLVSQFDAVLAIGEANRQFYRSHGVPEHRIFSAGYCVENERFQNAASAAFERRTLLRRSWGIPDDSLCFLFCGKFESKKHPIELVRAFGEAVVRIEQIQESNGNDHSSSENTESGITGHERVPIHLLMVGDGELRSECETIARELRSTFPASGFSLRTDLPVTFTGFLNQGQIIDAYVAADVLVLPSDHGETWGLVVNEAMACGRPAIVSDQIGCASDLIREEQTGWIFKFGDWEQLADQMIQICDDPTVLVGMEPHCRRLIKAWSPLAAAEGIVRAVHSLTQP